VQLLGNSSTESIFEIAKKLVEADRDLGIAALNQFDDERRDMAFHSSTGLVALVDRSDPGILLALIPGVVSHPSEGTFMSEFKARICLKDEQLSRYRPLSRSIGSAPDRRAPQSSHRDNQSLVVNATRFLPFTCSIDTK
jgi:hypothetical protein